MNVDETRRIVVWETGPEAYGRNMMEGTAIQMDAAMKLSKQLNDSTNPNNDRFHQGRCIACCAPCCCLCAAARLFGHITGLFAPEVVPSTETCWEKREGEYNQNPRVGNGCSPKTVDLCTVGVGAACCTFFGVNAIVATTTTTTAATSGSAAKVAAFAAKIV